MDARVIDITTGATIPAGTGPIEPMVKCRICGERPRIVVFRDGSLEGSGATIQHVCDEFDISMILDVNAATDAQVLAKWNRLMRT